MTKASNEGELVERMGTFTIRRTKHDAEVRAVLPQTVRQVVIVDDGPTAKTAAAIAVDAVAAGDRPLVFAHLRETAAACSREFATLCGSTPVQSALLTGDDPPERRAEKVARIKEAGGPAAAFATIDSTGMGISLSNFDVVIFAEMHAIGTRNLQAEERVYEVTRDRPVGVYYCVRRGTRDEQIARLVCEKLDQADALLGPDRDSESMRGALRGALGGARGTPRPLVDLAQRLRSIGC